VGSRVERDTLIWTLVVFFGASVLFAAIRNATEDNSVVLSVGLQALAGLLVVAAIVLVVRRRSGR
jgi:membrane protein DedA with SNARE-associated domain